MQTELFEDCPQPREHPPVWEDLPKESQEAAVRILARLIERILWMQQHGGRNE